jgi:uncharacterized protein (TIGR02453 family)
MNNTFKFLKELSKNNSRTWFHENKAMYEKSHKEMVNFAEKLQAKMNDHDFIETSSGKKCLYRIYRDVRFGRDKTPYKTNWAGFIRRASLERRGGYYFQVGLNGSFVMGGFFGPNKEDLLHIRRQIDQDPEPMRDIIESKQFRDFFGMLNGSKLKTAPRGFDKDHPDIDLLRYKQFILRHDFTQEEVYSKDFPVIVSHSFKQMRPFFDYMSEILTTDLNGQSLL